MNTQADAVNINVRELRAFVAIARLASFTRAATLLHSTQPALSARIRELEGALGVRLFDRSTRSVSLTQAGEALLPVVEQALADLRSVVDRARDVAAGTTGRVAIAALPSVSSDLLPAAVARFRRRHPGVTIALYDAIGDRVLELLRGRDVDLGVTSVGGDDPKLELTPLGTDRIVAVLPRAHTLATRRELTLATLIEHTLILMDRNSSVRHIIDATYAARGSMPVPSYEATFMATAIGLVRAGLGIALLPSTAQEVRAARDLAVRPIDDPGLTRTIGILRLRERTLSPAAQAFVAVLRQEARTRFSPHAAKKRNPRQRGGRSDGT